MVLQAFGGSLGLLFKALGSSWELFGASRSTKEGLQIRLGTLLGLVCSLLAAENGLGWVLGPSMSFFISSRNLLGSILSSHTDPPTLKNLDFPEGILTFLKNQRFRSKDGFESVLGALSGSFWELLGVFWGGLGSSLKPLDRPKGVSRFVLALSWASFACFLLPKMALVALWDVFGSFGASWGRF